MTVNQLIEALSKVEDKEKDVWVYDGESDRLDLPDLVFIDEKDDIFLSDGFPATGKTQYSLVEKDLSCVKVKSIIFDDTYISRNKDIWAGLENFENIPAF